MTERQVTFIDVDENRLELWLKRDRVQLVVIDSRPELEAGELRRFASVVFAEYVARDLGATLAVTRQRLRAARDLAASEELGAALDGALRALDDLAAAVAVPEIAAAAPASRDEPAVAPISEPAPVAEPPAPRQLTGRQPYRLAKASARGKRAGERGAPGWAASRRRGPIAGRPTAR